MTPLLSTALMGYFILSAGTSTSFGSSAQLIAPQAPTKAPLSVSMTAYNAVTEQTDGDPTTTASGAFSNPEVVAARSVDLKEQLPFGTVIQVITESSSSPMCGIGMVKEQIGYRVIADSMHPRKRNQIDLLFDNDNKVMVGSKNMNPALVFGMCKNIRIVVVGKVDINRIPKTQASLRAQIVGGQLALADLN